MTVTKFGVELCLLGRCCPPGSSSEREPPGVLEAELGTGSSSKLSIFDPRRESNMSSIPCVSEAKKSVNSAIESDKVRRELQS